MAIDEYVDNYIYEKMKKQYISNKISIQFNTIQELDKVLSET